MVFVGMVKYSTKYLISRLPRLLTSHNNTTLKLHLNDLKRSTLLEGKSISPLSRPRQLFAWEYHGPGLSKSGNSKEELRDKKNRS
jgi:hypothetical protein